MKKRTLGVILQIPLWILLLAIFISFIYLSFKGFGGMSGATFLKYAVPVWLIILLYLIGRLMEKKSKDFPTF